MRRQGQANGGRGNQMRREGQVKMKERGGMVKDRKQEKGRKFREEGKLKKEEGTNEIGKANQGEHKKKGRREINKKSNIKKQFN